MSRELIVWAVAAVWLSVIAASLWQWERYDTTPGRSGEPAETAVTPLCDRWQLTLFAHPHCPCSRAALIELATLPRAAPTLSIRVLFVRPPEGSDGWESGAGWDAAAQIPGAEVACDAGGAEARRLGAETSGFAVLTDPTGRIVFRGGLTPARGRTGDSPGRRAVLGWLNDGAGAPGAPVFGCPLFTPDDEPEPAAHPRPARTARGGRP